MDNETKRITDKEMIDSKKRVYNTVTTVFGLIIINDEMKINVDNIYPLMETLKLSFNNKALLSLIRDATISTNGDIDPSKLDEAITKKNELFDEFDEDDYVTSAFNFIDQNGNGAITMLDIYKLYMNIGHMLTDEQLTDIHRAVDLDGDGKITYDDFKMFLGFEITREDNDVFTEKQFLQPENSFRPGSRSSSRHMKHQQESNRQSCLWGYTSKGDNFPTQTSTSTNGHDNNTGSEGKSANIECDNFKYDVRRQSLCSEDLNVPSDLPSDNEVEFENNYLQNDNYCAQTSSDHPTIINSRQNNTNLYFEDVCTLIDKHECTPITERVISHSNVEYVPSEDISSLGLNSEAQNCATSMPVDFVVASSRTSNSWNDSENVWLSESSMNARIKEIESNKCCHKDDSRQPKALKRPPRVRSVKTCHSSDVIDGIELSTQKEMSANDMKLSNEESVHLENGKKVCPSVNHSPNDWLHDSMKKHTLQCEDNIGCQPEYKRVDIENGNSEIASFVSFSRFAGDATAFEQIAMTIGNSTQSNPSISESGHGSLELTHNFSINKTPQNAYREGAKIKTSEISSKMCSRRGDKPLRTILDDMVSENGDVEFTETANVEFRHILEFDLDLCNSISENRKPVNRLFRREFSKSATPMKKVNSIQELILSRPASYPKPLSIENAATKKAIKHTAPRINIRFSMNNNGQRVDARKDHNTLPPIIRDRTPPANMTDCIANVFHLPSETLQANNRRNITTKTEKVQMHEAITLPKIYRKHMRRSNFYNGSKTHPNYSLGVVNITPDKYYDFVRCRYGSNCQIR